MLQTVLRLLPELPLFLMTALATRLIMSFAQTLMHYRLLPSPDGFSWPVALAEQRSPLAPAPLQSLRHYYGLLRPCTPLRYSRPRGWSRL
jgi:hypothetical protein